jgi:methionyl-tRNA formyltransferase
MKLIFAGTPQIAATTLERLSALHEVVLVITRPDASVGRSSELTPSPVAQLAGHLGLNVLKTNRLSADEFETVAAAKADLGIVVAFGALIKQPVLGALPWWNLHFSLLPKWRGASPLQHSILAGGEGAGITIFQLDEGLDTGPIISSMPLSIGDYNAGEALEVFAAAGLDLLLATVEQLPAGVEQLGEPSFAPKISRADAKLYFDRPAIELQQQVRAYNPEPMAWASFHGQPLRVLSAIALAQHSTLAPGQLGLVDRALAVGCGENSALVLESVQPAGKRAMSALDWYRGSRGDRLD